ncbi:MAG: SHOCT domain-containing protein, partial [Dolichospermum sp.]
AERTLRQLKKLFEEGLITEEEYKIKRQSLVDKL